MSEYGSTPPPPPPPPPSGQNPYGVPGPADPQQGYGAPQGYNAPPPPAPGMAPQGSFELASWGTRAGGYIIDLLLIIPGIILYFIGTPNITVDSTGHTTTTGGSLAVLALGWLYIIGIQIWNRWLKGGRTGQTVGRGVVGVKVVDANTGQPIGPLKAFIRDIAHIVDSIICGLPIGWLSPLWDAKKQTWGDKIMSTVAIRVAK